jgi:hypothetical protein
MKAEIGQLLHLAQALLGSAFGFATDFSLFCDATLPNESPA